MLGIRMGWGAAAALGVAALVQAGAACADGPARLTSYGPTARPSGAAWLCSAFQGACHHASLAIAPAQDAQALSLARSVSALVNHTIVPRDQRFDGPQADAWTLPVANQGDCKRFAVMKKQMLAKAGLPPSSLLLAVVLRPDNDLHAVLVLRSASGDYVLDNLTDSVRAWTDTGYTFLKMQDPAHGERWNLILLGPRARRA